MRQAPFFFHGVDIEDFKQVYFDKGRLDHALMQKTDIGFVVIKPLPKTIFGRTCLKTYDVDQGRRHYITRNYDINFPTEERFIPNEGLGIDQMVHSIYSVGLEP